MATDCGKIVDQLKAFYQFDDKTIISVGAGGGQLIEYSRNARKVLANDSDKKALQVLEERLVHAGMDKKYTLIHSDYLQTNLTGDAVIFEFCLHEMKSSAAAIEKAQESSQDILIVDHWIDSEWAYLASEGEKVANSWKELEAFQFRKFQTYEIFQKFGDYEELYDKVKGQGEQTIARIEPFKGQVEIEIPMTYCFAMI